MINSIKVDEDSQQYLVTKIHINAILNIVDFPLGLALHPRFLRITNKVLSLFYYVFFSKR